ncbi:MAG TPA: hypothetical protein VES21_08750 [Nocardioidaceae bacterium]|nr:hypothetical protein [Nocardioidaceae bacterium]
MSDNQASGDRAADRHPPEPPPAYAGSPSYPTYPTYPASSAAPGSQWGDPSPAAPEQPSTIRNAVRLMWAGAALSLLSLLVTLLSLDSMESRVRRELTASDTGLTAEDVDGLIGVFVAFAVITALLGALLWLWMAWKNGQGRSWARIVATVLGGLNLLSSMFAISSSPGALELLLTLANLVLAVVILALLWSKPSSAFYDAVKRHRMA